MFRTASLTISAVTALSIAIAPSPATADPDAGDIAAVVAGLAVIGILAKAASDRNDRRNSPAVAESADDFGRLGSFDDYSGTRIIDGELRRHDEPRQWGKHRGYKKQPLPERCLREVDTGHRDRLVYLTRCLERSYKFAAKLPVACERLVRTDRRRVSVYSARCLARDGWRVASR